jgi:DNA polymerase
MFVGEGPGEDEDARGEPFVGPAGQLLTKMIAAMGYEREQVFIANIVKCRPPKNRVPEPAEIEACTPWLERQIALIRPKCLVALGATAFKGLTGNMKVNITNVRGIWHKHGDIPLMPTFHPAYLLRMPPAKKSAWEDLKKVLEFLGKSPPPPNQSKA